MSLQYVDTVDGTATTTRAEVLVADLQDGRILAITVTAPVDEFGSRFLHLARRTAAVTTTAPDRLRLPNRSPVVVTGIRAYAKPMGPADLRLLLMNPDWEHFVDMGAELIATTARRGEHWTFATDFDGTAGDMVDLPDEAEVSPLVLRGYAALTEAVPDSDSAIITGRWLDYMVPRVPDEAIDLYCDYGLETRTGGTIWQHPEIVQWTPAIRAFASNLARAIEQAGGRWSTSAREARDNDALYIEIKPTAVTVHRGPALSKNPSSNVTQVLLAAISAVHEQNLVRRPGEETEEQLLVHNGHHEFLAPMTLDGTVVDKGTVVASLRGRVMYACDDFADIPAAKVVRARGGLVVVVNRSGETKRESTPAELLDLAHVVVPNARQHGGLVTTLAARMTRELAPTA